MATRVFPVVVVLFLSFFLFFSFSFRSRCRRKDEFVVTSFSSSCAASISDKDRDLAFSLFSSFFIKEGRCLHRDEDLLSYFLHLSKLKYRSFPPIFFAVEFIARHMSTDLLISFKTLFFVYLSLYIHRNECLCFFGLELAGCIEVSLFIQILPIHPRDLHNSNSSSSSSPSLLLFLSSFLLSFFFLFFFFSLSLSSETIQQIFLSLSRVRLAIYLSLCGMDTMFPSLTLHSDLSVVSSFLSFYLFSLGDQDFKRLLSLFLFCSSVCGVCTVLCCPECWPSELSRRLDSRSLHFYLFSVRFSFFFSFRGWQERGELR